MKILTKHSVIGFITGCLVISGIITFSIHTYMEVQKIGMIENVRSNLCPPVLYCTQELNYEWDVFSTEGEKINASELFKDKVVFLNFWSTSCIPCIGEMPSIQKLYDKWGDRITFACISYEDIGKIKDFIEDQEFTFPFYKVDKIPKEFNVGGIPDTFIISKDRKIRYRHVGSTDWNHLNVHKFVESLLEE